jgi:hypothetical protein
VALRARTPLCEHNNFNGFFDILLADLLS